MCGEGLGTRLHCKLLLNDLRLLSYWQWSNIECDQPPATPLNPNARAYAIPHQLIQVVRLSNRLLPCSFMLTLTRRFCCDLLTGACTWIKNIPSTRWNLVWYSWHSVAQEHVTKGLQQATLRTMIRKLSTCPGPLHSPSGRASIRN